MRRPRALILYATRQGQTAKVAERISSVLEARGIAIGRFDAADAARLAGLDIDGFDLLVFGASMHAGGIEKELVKFINNRREELEKKPRAFFLVLLSAATEDPALRARWLDDARTRMNEQLEVDFDTVEMIAGALTYSKYSWPLKWIMRTIARKAGAETDMRRDYEYTDWLQVEAFAHRLADRLA